jgi:transcriptional regulator with XRE-family HTH domain
MILDDLLLLAQAGEWAQSGYARQLRVNNHLTQQLIGDHCGVTATAVSHWESADRTPRGRPALRFARLLNELAARAPDRVAS